MPYRVEVAHLPESRDALGESLCKNIKNMLDLPVKNVATVSVYIVDLPISGEQAVSVKDEILTDPVIQFSSLEKLDTGNFDWCIEIGFKPGVTDSVGGTAKEAVTDLLGKSFERDEKVYTARQYRLIAPELTEEQTVFIGEKFLGNTLIETIAVQSYETWKNSPPRMQPPSIRGKHDFTVAEYDLNIGEDDLMKLSNERTLSLSAEEMRTMQDYFNRADVRIKRKDAGISERITDVELESLAQTWSEHCKHKIFNSLITYRENGSTTVIDSIFNTYIKESTRIIGERVPWLLSVFKDNAGVIGFNDQISLVYKVETHNSPSALEPYGGALTGIVGVNRDPMGTGLGAGLLYNVWGYCFGSPFLTREVPSGLLHPNRIRENVHKGVIDGGNQSGIPYARGWEFFDNRYIGKPLVFCGTVGYLPAKINGMPSHEKSVSPGALIVMVGGRIGKDGIHGATFSSAELTEDSPAQAVQIGDPITQKKMYDFLLEARDRGLYACITDNGAGGLSSSVGEMAQFSGGCYLDLSNAPLKYEGLDPWEILISEAQERMTIAVLPEKKSELFELAKKRGVEATKLGKYTNSGYFHVVYKGRTVAYLDMDFLHDGVPQMKLEAVWTPPELSEPQFEEPHNLTETLKTLLSRLNICSNEGKARQYDHEVKGLSVVKPFIGINKDVPADAAVMLVEYDSLEGVVLAEGKNPHYSDIDTYHMAASAIDEAVRRVISGGGTLNHMAGLDNFCWPDPVQSEKTPDGSYKLAQLVRANRALYDYTLIYNVPCISGKDSMKNDFITGNEKISIPPTLLFSVIGKINDVTRSVTMDVKIPGDLVYILGDTLCELGGSEYYQMTGEQLESKAFIGTTVPKVDAVNALKLYKTLEQVTAAEAAHSIHTPTIGGLAVALAKSAFAGGVGITIDLREIPQDGCSRNDQILFSESNSRFIVTVPPDNKDKFEHLLAGNTFSEAGQTTEEKRLRIIGLNGDLIIDAPLEDLRNAWKSTLKDFFYAEA